MSLLLSLVAALLQLYLVVLIIRMVFDWIQVFARDWRPSGVVLVVANVIYGLTDPPLNALRRLIPPLRLGGVALDIGFMLLFFAVVVLINLTSTFALTMAR